MRTKKGVITSAKMTDTVSVAVHRLVFHPVYKKRYRKSKKFLCDTNGMDLYEGDKVVIEECKPLSKNKHFKVTEIIKAAPRVSDMKDDAAIEEVIHREKTGADADAKAKKEEKKETPETPTTDEADSPSQE
ncbi:MAG: 30S ribosomal protein S17 [Candidatus Peribacter sp.]|jgi:small subunit ribosomal protein S17|nr:30S ribosomal protein S17 [Candidatus Peribacter sp.]MBT4392522.1 30S ribosomal protein S17 [Candidatus Peribacter sp.]MBT4601397.1 30S ribosomal protein S17 [Candidatus Peribacter sp.]MBT5149535.1 30S ribosomal protein S17 [Candidatus Peribacter sp.]MBT5638087.1 30S ribosomal protein S17 [Candidatus Peribacter sp.]